MSGFSQVVSEPSEGVPQLIDTPEGFFEAARQLERGTGAFAIDTERASSFRYDDRAFLIQIRRRGAGTFLFDPEVNRAELSAALAPVLNGQEWIIHAAPTDLPCLAWLDLKPGTIFDTELASRLAGYSRPNLGHMVEVLLGVVLEKGYGDSDWSLRPLPKEQLSYAALDVEFLLELAECLTDILAEADKLDIAYEEFSHIVEKFQQVPRPEEATWRDLKGLATLNSAAQLNVARELWRYREGLARTRDKAAGRILPNKVILEIARQLPKSRAQLINLRGFPRRRDGAAERWWSVLNTALKSDPHDWPRPEKLQSVVPSKIVWARDYPDLWEIYQEVRTTIEETASALSIRPDTLLNSSDIRHVLWAILGSTNSKMKGNVARSITRPDQVPDVLARLGARQWQIEFIAPIIVQKTFRRH